MPSHVGHLMLRKLPWLLVPVLLQQPRLASFHATDFKGNRLSLLTTEESKPFRRAIQAEIGKQRETETDPRILDANEAVERDLERRLALIRLPFDYLERHTFHYTYLGPLDPRTKGSSIRPSPAWLGRPELVRLKMLHAESAASYHFEVEAPPDSVIVNRTVDHYPQGFKYIALRGGLEDPELDPPTQASDPWRTGEHATVYICNGAGHGAANGAWLNLWIALQRNTLWRPLSTTLAVAIVTWLTALLPIPPKDGSSLSVPASLFLALASAFLGYLSPPKEHPLTKLVYMGAHRAVVLGALISFLALIRMIVYSSQIPPENPFHMTADYAAYPVAVASLIPLAWLLLIYAWSAREKVARRYVLRQSSSPDYLKRLAVASREVG